MGCSHNTFLVKKRYSKLLKIWFDLKISNPQTLLKISDLQVLLKISPQSNKGIQFNQWTPNTGGRIAFILMLLVNSSYKHIIFFKTMQIKKR